MALDVTVFGATGVAANADTADGIPIASLPSRTALALYGFAFFASAFLLFQVQLIIAKYTLPWFGGTPAVFTACMVFFQLLLLLGYVYAQVLTVYLRPRTQVAMHTFLLGFALAFLAVHLTTWASPLLPGNHWKAVNSGRPLLQILCLLSASVALPFFALSTTGPLLQAWFSRRYERLPYRWYAVSNAGSLLGLVTYPFAVEPRLSLRMQANAWSICFAMFAAACAWLAIAFKPAPSTFEVTRPGGGSLAPPPTWSRRIVWLALAACGSLMLLATTNQICQDVAVVPLLWVLPLSLYLLSFVLCFDSERWYSRALWSLALGLATLFVTLAIYHPLLPLMLQIAIYSFALFAACMVCHGELARLKPVAGHLTRFYLSLAAGGAVGGVFVSIIAPLLFKGFWEFQISLWLCCLALSAVLLRDSVSWIYRPQPWLLAFSALLVFFGPLLAGLDRKPVTLASTFVATLALIAFIFTGQRPAADEVRLKAARFSVVFTAILLAVILGYPAIGANFGAVATSRNFYGVMAISEVATENPEFHARWLRHGKILHGFQYLSSRKRQTPTGYYAPHSGIGLAITNHPARLAGNNMRIGVVGLGVGTIAAYGHRGDYLRFYEINPDVIRVAAVALHNFFTYVADSPAQVEVILGDARVSMERELARHDQQRFDVLAVDAFSGDAVPLHLLTAEAFNVYLQHLRGPDSVLAFHISNRSLDLSPAVSRIAEHFGRTAWLVDTAESGDKEVRSIWVLVSKVRNLPPGERFTLLQPNRRFPLWTDDYSNVLAVLRWSSR